MYPTSPLTCVLLDGNDHQRAAFTHLLQQLADLTLAAAYATTEEALAFFRQGGQADIIFVAADIPSLNVLDLLALLRGQPQLIVLADKDFEDAQMADLQDIICLQHPISLVCLRQAVQRVQEQLTVEEAPVPPSVPRYTSALFVKNGARLVRVSLTDIIYIEAVDDYANLVTERQKLLVSSNLKVLAAQLPPDFFQRIHRSYIINVGHAVSIEENMVSLTKGSRLPIGKSYRDSFYRLLIRV